MELPVHSLKECLDKIHQMVRFDFRVMCMFIPLLLSAAVSEAITTDPAPDIKWDLRVALIFDTCIALYTSKFMYRWEQLKTTEGVTSEYLQDTFETISEIMFFVLVKLWLITFPSSALFSLGWKYYVICADNIFTFMMAGVLVRLLVDVMQSFIHTSKGEVVLTSTSDIEKKLIALA